MTCDLLIIQPNTKHHAYPGMGDLPAVEPPLWARLIAGYCRDKGWRVKILDLEAVNCPNGVAFLAGAPLPKLVVVMASGHQPSASTQAMPAVREVCASIKEHSPSLPILLVGGHVATLPERTLLEEPCDYVCTGEGPVTVDELLHELCAAEFFPGAVSGLGYRDERGKPYQTLNPPLVNVDQLHGAAWDLLPMGQYRAHNWHCDDGRPRDPYASIYTSLGCPYSCSFCCINAPFGKSSYRMRDPGLVVAEIAHLHDAYGVTNFKITDEMFVLNPRHVRSICTLLAALPYADDLNIWAYARVDTAARHAGLLPLMRKAGIRWLALGIESADDTVRDGADKAINLDVIGVVREIQAAGIKVIGNFIFGLPGDTTDKMMMTLALAKAAECDFVNFYSAMAYPGSELYREHQAVPEHLPDNWAGYAQHSFECKPLPTETMTSAEVLTFRDFAHESYFASDPILKLPLKRKLLMPGAVA